MFNFFVELFDISRKECEICYLILFKENVGFVIFGWKIIYLTIYMILLDI